MALARIPLSASTGYRGVKVVATATPGTTIHTAHATAIDTIWLWADNAHTADVKLTLERGGTTGPDDHVVLTIPKEAGLLVVLEGIPLTNSLVLKAFAAVANVVVLSGFVNREG